MHRKLLLTITVLFVTLLASAQTDRKTFFVSGSANFRLDGASQSVPQSSPAVPSLAYPTTTRYSLNPHFGFFVTPKWAIGVITSYERSSQRSNQAWLPEFGVPGLYNSPIRDTRIVTQAWATGVFGQYYHMFTDKFGLFSTIAVQYGKKTEDFVAVSSQFRFVAPDPETGYPINPPPVSTPPVFPSRSDYKLPTVRNNSTFIQANLDIGLIYFFTPKAGLTFQATFAEFYSRKGEIAIGASNVQRESAMNIHLIPINFRFGLQWRFNAF